MYVKRLLSSTFQAALEEFPAVLVTGPRQSGKTTFIRNEIAEPYSYVSFDDPLNRDFATRDPVGFLDQFHDLPIILDEIQYVPDLLPYIKIRIDSDRDNKGAWVLTGSQQFQLMQGISESLAGRIAILELLPFNRDEISIAKDPDLHSLIWLGGYPEPLLHPKRRELWLRSYVQTYIERDVRNILNVSDLSLFQSLLRVMAGRHSRIFNQSSISRELGITQPTVKKWINVLSSSYIIYELSPYYKNFGKRIIKKPKLYFLDPALVCYLTQQPSPEAALAGSMGGPLFEGLVVSEVVKALSNAGKDPIAYFWRSHDGIEVDLILQSGTGLLPVEIKLTATPTVRHAEPLQRFKELAGLNTSDPGLVVCRTKESRPLPGNNLAIPFEQIPNYVGVKR